MPTHLLQDFQATALGSCEHIAGARFYREGEHWLLAGEARVERHDSALDPGQPLTIGDRIITEDGCCFTLIKVEH